MDREFDASKAPKEGRAEFPKFELQNEEVARINLLTTKGWAVTVRHWVEGVGYVHCHAVEKAKDLEDLLKIQDEGGRPSDCILCRMLDAGSDRVKLPKRHFAVKILRYKSDLQGRVDTKHLNYFMEIWLFDNRKYRTLHEILEEWGGKSKANIKEHDLGVKCTDAQYQNMTIQPLKTALWKPHSEAVQVYFKAEYTKYDLQECLGSFLDEEAIKRRFAQMERRTQTDTPPALADDIPFGDTPAELTPFTSSAESEDIFGTETEEKGEIPAVEESEEGGDFLGELLSDDKD